MPENQSKIAIITDGGCDLTNNEVLARGYSLIPVPLAFPDGSTSDSDSFAARDFWEALLSDYESLPKTSQPNRLIYDQKIQEAADAGYEEVIIITMSTGLSSTHDVALMAAENAVIPTRVFDSRIITWAMVVLCDQAIKAVNAGLSSEQAIDYLQAVRDSMSLLIVFDTLEYLVRGGRAGRTAGLLASALDIKPICTFEDDGVIDTVKKTRGRKKAFQAIPKILHERYGDADTDNLRYLLLRAEVDDVANELHDKIKETEMPGTFTGLEQIGIIVGIYAGPGTAASLHWRDLDPRDFAK
ncbi:MAG: DegV family protein [Coriobacteriia bacterium]|nr:DegV family protein [Coriobacteriia bacterium]MCL2745791.1 DegV family protein [Coriobacteriia bacterium]MCL2870074.1 DegV family protein [Coriobacteriia bacterium]